MPVGHTKFAPDWAFGLLKQTYRKTKVETMDDIASMIRGSAEVNEAHVVTEDNTSLKVYDWVSYLSGHFRPIDGITKYHFFRVTSENKGIIKQ